MLSTLIDQTERTSRQLLLPEALLERARARRALHSDEAAIDDLQRALQSLAARTGDQNHSYRDAYFAASDAAVRELVDLFDRRDDIPSALAAARRSTVPWRLPRRRPPPGR
jgi:hypothetical protein